MTDDTPNDLESRIERLEQTVDQQASVIRELLPEDVSPDRRALLRAGAGGIGLALAGGLGYQHGVGNARAANDQVGTPSVPVDLYAESAFNSDIGDSVDYLDPRWLALTDAVPNIYYFTSVDGYNQSTSGSGTVGTGTTAADLETGSTSGSHAEIEGNQGVSAGGRTASFDKDHAVRAAFRILDGNSDRTDYVTIGRVSGGEQGFGIKYDGSDILAVVHDGSSETPATVISGFSGNNVDALFEFTTGSELKVTANGNTATISSGLPSGDDFNACLLKARVENSTSSTRTLSLKPVMQVQLP